MPTAYIQICSDERCLLFCCFFCLALVHFNLFLTANLQNCSYSFGEVPRHLLAVPQEAEVETLQYVFKTYFTSLWGWCGFHH